jgi:flagellar motor component MotA
MDKISLVGLTLGIAAIVVGQVLEGGHLSSLFQPTALLIVIGGTLGAVMLQSPLRTFVDGMRMGRWVFVPPVVSPATIIDQVASWSAVARKEGLLTLENQIDALPDPFMRKGLQLLVDGVEPNRLREVLEVEIGVWEGQMRQAELQQLEVFREVAGHFNVNFKLPDLGDRVGLQEAFATHPFLAALREFFAGRLTAEECTEKILTLPDDSSAP